MTKRKTQQAGKEGVSAPPLRVAGGRSTSSYEWSQRAPERMRIRDTEWALCDAIRSPRSHGPGCNPIQQSIESHSARGKQPQSRAESRGHGPHFPQVAG